MLGMRIFDTFLFDGELTLLAHRLAETADLVDAIVLVEAGETFQGDPKPLIFQENAERFAAHRDKLRAVTLPRLGTPRCDPWQRERVQRDAILFALGDAEPDDVILILDADEMPSRSLLERLRRQGLNAPQRLLMTRHYERVDRLAPRSPCCADPCVPFPAAHPRLRPGDWTCLDIDWFSRSGVVAPFRALAPQGATAKDRVSPFELRRLAPVAGAYPDAGRHLSFVDPAARPLTKLRRTAHSEFAHMQGDPAAHLELAHRYAVHHRGWWYAERPVGALPEDLARLAQRLPHDGEPTEAPAALRHAMRCWAWLRSLEILPDWLLRLIDRHWSLLSPVLLGPLLVLDGLRAAAASRAPLESARLSSPTTVHGST